MAPNSQALDEMRGCIQCPLAICRDHIGYMLPPAIMAILTLHLTQNFQDFLGPTYSQDPGFSASLMFLANK